LATLGRRRYLYIVTQPKWTTWGCKSMSGDHLREHLVKFD